jgi:hypothetical protein
MGVSNLDCQDAASTFLHKVAGPGTYVEARCADKSERECDLSRLLGPLEPHMDWVTEPALGR